MNDHQAEFVISLLKAVACKESVALSPVSLFISLSICAEASRQETQKEILECLCTGKNIAQMSSYASELLQKYNVASAETLFCSGRLLVDSCVSILPSFRETMSVAYGVKLDSIDLTKLTSVVQEVNESIAAQTSGKIVDALSLGDFGDPHAMVLLTVAHFEAKWLHQFELRDTRSAPFHVDASTDIQVNMMMQTDEFLYLADDEFQVLGMAYESSRIAMFVFLPKVQHGLTHAMASLTGSTFFGRIRSCEKARVKVILPKFKFQASVEVRSLLQNLGVRNAFKPGIADFTGMVHDESQIHVGSVVQKVCVEVGEHGTTAAATGIMAFPPSGMPPRATIFNADHPFMYAIVDNNGLVLFAGFFFG